MSNFILTYLKKMSKLLTVPRFYGPVATVLFTVLYHLLAQYFGFSITLSWLWLFMILGIFIGGLRAGLVCAVFTIVYGLLALPMNTSRLAQLVITTPAAAFLVGYLRRRERLLREAILSQFSNGNVEKMQVSLRMATNLKHRFKTMSEADIQEVLEQIESNLGNALAVIEGYHFLRGEIERVNRFYTDPRNVEKVKRIEGRE